MITAWAGGGMLTATIRDWSAVGIDDSVAVFAVSDSEEEYIGNEIKVKEGLFWWTVASVVRSQ